MRRARCGAGAPGQTATGINPSNINEFQAAFLLVPVPEPSSLLLLLGSLGLTGALALRQRGG